MPATLEVRMLPVEPRSWLHALIAGGEWRRAPRERFPGDPDPEAAGRLQACHKYGFRRDLPPGSATRALLGGAEPGRDRLLRRVAQLRGTGERVTWYVATHGGGNTYPPGNIRRLLFRRCGGCQGAVVPRCDHCGGLGGLKTLGEQPNIINYLSCDACDGNGFRECPVCSRLHAPVVVAGESISLDWGDWC